MIEVGGGGIEGRERPLRRPDAGVPLHLKIVGLFLPLLVFYWVSLAQSSGATNFVILSSTLTRSFNTSMTGQIFGAAARSSLAARRGDLNFSTVADGMLEMSTMVGAIANDMLDASAQAGKQALAMTDAMFSKETTANISGGGGSSTPLLNGGSVTAPPPLLPLKAGPPSEGGGQALAAAPLPPSATAGGRWRGNMYIRDDGILPWQMGVGVRPGLSLGSVPLSPKIQLGFSVLAASVWGNSDETGKPTSFESVSLLLWYQRFQNKCDKFPRNPFFHCVLPNWLSLRFECKIMDGEWAPARRIPRGNGSFWTRDPSVAQDAVYCDLPAGLSLLPDEFGVKVRVFENAASTAPMTNKTMDVKVVYSHVNQTWPIAVCTEPMYHFKNVSGFWYGNGAANGAKRHSLLDEFVVHHYMQGAKVNVYDFDDSLAAPMQKYRGNPSIAYNPGWAIRDLWSGNTGLGSVAYETHAETTCMWEHRTRAKWVQVLHSVDNMALPKAPGTTMGQVAALLNTSELSAVLVPTTGASTPGKYKTSPKSVAHQYSLLGGTNTRSRFTPLGDPRAFDSICVHWFKAPRPNSRGEKPSSYALNVMKYHTVHMMSMSRKNMDTHGGNEDPAWKALGDRLIEELQALPADVYGRRRL